MSFAVLHISKGKGSVGGLGRHVEREKVPLNADPTKQNLNQHFIQTGRPLSVDIQARIQEGYTGKTAIRKDAVKCLNIVLSGSHVLMKSIEKDPAKLKAWVEENRAFINEQYRPENVMRFSLHLDERTPHLHVVVVPLKDGKLTAKEVMGNSKNLTELQTAYGKRMEKFGLRRGIENSRASHTGVKEFYGRINAPIEATEMAYKPLSTLESIKVRINPDNVLKAKFEAAIEPLVKEVQVLRHERQRNTTLSKHAIESYQLAEKQYKIQSEKLLPTMKRLQEENFKLATDETFRIQWMEQVRKVQEEKKNQEKKRGLGL
jgi:hypothetical protein